METYYLKYVQEKKIDKWEFIIYCLSLLRFLKSMVFMFSSRGVFSSLWRSFKIAYLSVDRDFQKKGVIS